jgi:hypothetical protein
MYGVERTGVRFVVSSPSDPDRVDDYHAWYDIYGTVVTHLGHLVNCFRFENPAAAGTEEDPRSVAIYDIVTPDPAIAWPATESSERHPKYLFDDPRSSLVSPALRGSWAHVGSLAKEGEGASRRRGSRSSRPTSRTRSPRTPARLRPSRTVAALRRSGNAGPAPSRSTRPTCPLTERHHRRAVTVVTAATARNVARIEH